MWLASYISSKLGYLFPRRSAIIIATEISKIEINESNDVHLISNCSAF